MLLRKYKWILINVLAGYINWFLEQKKMLQVCVHIFKIYTMAYGYYSSVH